MRLHLLLVLAFWGAGALAAETETPPPAANEPESLEAAYEREFAFLDTQRRELNRLLAELQRNQEQQEKRMASELERLQRQILDLSLEEKRLEDAVLEAEKSHQAQQEDAALLEMTLTQAQTSLQDAGIEIGALAGDNAARLERLFALARQVLEDGGRLHRRPGRFFLPDGRETQGSLVFLGHIAAYGLSETASGILAPAGGGHLKLIAQPGGAETARALAAGDPPAKLQVFLFENLTQAVELEQAKSWRQILDDGGPIAWITAALGAVGLALALVRGVVLAQASRSRRFFSKAGELLRQGDRAAALALLENARGAYPAVVRASLSHAHLPDEEWEIAVSDALLRQSIRLDRFSSLILVSAAVAPLLGLLGTVTGMIATFDVITRFGTGDPKLLATGIAIALITTEVGLIVAIPLLLLGNMLNGWSQSLKDALEIAALEIRASDQTPSAGREKLPRYQFAVPLEAET